MRQGAEECREDDDECIEQVSGQVSNHGFFLLSSQGLHLSQ
jgi:hypothetical protein